MFKWIIIQISQYSLKKRKSLWILLSEFNYAYSYIDFFILCLIYIRNLLPWLCYRLQNMNILHCETTMSSMLEYAACISISDLKGTRIGTIARIFYKMFNMRKMRMKYFMNNIVFRKLNYLY